jgi:hypothetical protein
LKRYEEIHNARYENNYRAGGVTQVAEHLPTKCEALSSSPSITKKKKGKLESHTNKNTVQLKNGSIDM